MGPTNPCITESAGSHHRVLNAVRCKIFIAALQDLGCSYHRVSADVEPLLKAKANPETLGVGTKRRGAHH